jgi:arylsulfatase A-like enzyme
MCLNPLRRTHSTAAWTLVAIALCGSWTIACEKQPSVRERPNVLLVTLDTTRADRMGCYGGREGVTPHFDGLAAEGVRFDLAIAQASVTPVSHASILTGRDPYGHGLRVMHAADAFRLPSDTPTLTTLLRDEGFATGAFLSSFTVSEHFGFANGFDHFDNGLTNPAETVMQRRAPGRFAWDSKSNQRRSDSTTERAGAWLRSTERPFFAWVHYWDPHDHGLLPPPAVVRQWVPAGLEGDAANRAMYEAELHYVDRQFGALLDTLRDAGVYDDTIIVVVADHGQGLGDHGWWFHRILYQEQIRVPLLVKIPRETQGLVVSDLVRSIDVAPTVLELLGVEPPEGTQGRSLLPLVSGEPEEPRIAYADQLNLFDLDAGMVERRPNDDLLFCAMDRSWKLIHRPLHPEFSELFYLPDDPGEKENLYDPNHPQAQRLLRFLEQSGGFVDSPFGDSLDEDTLERLRALGYAAP